MVGAEVRKMHQEGLSPLVRTSQEGERVQLPGEFKCSSVQAVITRLQTALTPAWQPPLHQYQMGTVGIVWQ